MENVDDGMVHSEKNVYTEYTDPRRSEWITTIEPALKKPKLKALVEECKEQLSRRELIRRVPCRFLAALSSGEVAEPAPVLGDRGFEHAERDRRALLQAMHAVRDRQVPHESRR